MIQNHRKEHYSTRAEALTKDINRLRNRARAFIVGEVSSFVAIVALIVLYTTAEASWLRLGALAVAALCLVIYLFVRSRDVANDLRIQQQEALLMVYEYELRAEEGDYAAFDDGSRYVDPAHAYSYDLDLFGRDSLFQRMSRLVTTGGSDALAARLCHLDGDVSAVSCSESGGKYDAAYRERIERLAADEAFRAEFIAQGVRRKIDVHAIREVLDAVAGLSVPSWMGRGWVRLLAYADLMAFGVVVVMAVLGRVEPGVAIWWGIAQFFAVYLLCKGPLTTIHRTLNRLHDQLRAFVSLATLAEGTALPVFKRLVALLDGLDKRGNILGLFVVNTVSLYDLFLVRKFIQWRREGVDEIRGKMAHLVELDQEVTIATFLYNHPGTSWAKVNDEDGVKYVCSGLCHPFLADDAVRNDFVIDDRHFYIVTGANMAGKSTFLRSVGINYVLAMCGIPVFADSLEVSRFNLFSSMRTSDDLSRGISYFNAELIRLQQLITYCHAHPHTLIILDEILKGTNSLDKLNGSRLFLEAISRLPVSGVIATHDLELSKMEDERFHNYCFEIELGEDVHYSYKISAGVARNQNATFLLKKLLAGV